MTARKKAALKRGVALTLIVISAFYLASDPRVASSAAASGIELCLKTVIPALFPFMVLSALFTTLGGAETASRVFAPVMRVFRVGGAGASALILGLIGGYPIGAKTVSSLYLSGLLEKREAEKLLAFTANCGLGFTVGVVGSAIFGSAKIGLTLYIIHIFSALLTGFCFRGVKCSHRHDPAQDRQNTRFAPAFTAAVKGSFRTCVDICGFIVIFGVIISLLDSCGILKVLISALNSLGLSPAGAKSLAFGFFELSNGAGALPDDTVTRTHLACAAFILAWGGVSVHFQTMAVLEGSGLRLRLYFLGKACQSAIASATAFIFYSLFAPQIPAFSASGGAISPHSGKIAAFSLYAPPAVAAILIIFYLISRKLWKKA